MMMHPWMKFMLLMLMMSMLMIMVMMIVLMIIMIITMISVVIYQWFIDDISMIYRWNIDGLSMIEPCFGMNGHPRARMSIIWRQCEADVKIFNLQAFQHRFMVQMVDYSCPRVQYEKNLQNVDILKLFFWFLYRSRGSREPSWRVQNRSGSWKASNNEKKKLNFV